MPEEMRSSLRLTVRPVGRIDPMALFRRVTRGHWPFFLDSSLRESDLARYSFLGSDPCGWFRTRGPDALWQTPWSEGSSKGDPLRALGAFLEGLPWATAGDPVYPFLGGCVGYFSYDLGRHIERIPDGKAPDLQVPDIHLAVYPRIYVVDHIWGETFVIAPRSRIAIDPAEVPEESTVPSNPDAIETRPIKGTRPRASDAPEDRALAEELLASEKDAAENVMIVDLERNDLGKVCEFGSVHVPVLKALRSLPNVHHLESVVRGRLRADVTIPELLRATFPGGSITGAPKPRAMEIIERLEPHRRGVYSGSLGYISWDRSLDWNIAIRTATVIGGTAHFAVAGAIGADSNPEAEYRETLDKLRGHAEAITGDRVEVTPDGLRMA